MIITGDCREAMLDLRCGSVQTVCTSPPYYGLRDFQHQQQVGAEASHTEYVQALVEIMRSVRVLLRNSGTVWLNMGDAYTRNGGVGKPGPNAKVGNTRRRIQRRNLRAPERLGQKQLFALPWRTALALQDDGWIIAGDFIWHKSNAMPESVRDRPTRSHEHVFLLAKQPDFWYDASAVDGTVWSIPTQRSKVRGFPAAFPEALAAICIRAGSRLCDTVLDPFCGSGTVGAVCRQLNRKFVGIEINDEYAEAARDRIGAA